MLALDSRLEVRGVALYRDHLTPHRFYYLPGPPRLAVGEGRQGLELTRYRGARSGGLLLLDVDLEWPEATLHAVRAELEAQHGCQIELAPVLFQEGTAHLTALGTTSAPAAAGTAPRLVERIIGSATPSLLGQQRAIFSLLLEPDGVQLVQAALSGVELPLVVAYELLFGGLRPARGLRARVHYQLAFASLRSRIVSDSLVFSVDLDREVEALTRDGHIEIEDIDARGLDAEALARRRSETAAALRELIELIFFRPATSPGALGPLGLGQAPAISAAWERGGRSQTALALRALQQQEEDTLTYDLRESSLSQVRIAPQGALRLPVGMSLHDRIRDVEVADEAALPTRVQVFCAAESDWTGVAGVVVDVRAGSELRSLVIDPTSLDAEALLPVPQGVPLEHRLRVLRDEASAGPAAPLPWLPLTVRHLAVDPAALSGQQTRELCLGAFDPEVVSQVRVRLQHDGVVEELTLTPEQPMRRIRHPAGAVLQLSAVLQLKDGQSLQLEQRIGAEPAIVINQPAHLYQVVTVRFHDPLGRYEAIFVEIEGTEPAGAPRRTVQVGPSEPERLWSRLLPAGLPRSYSYRLRRIGKDARIEQEDWQLGQASLLIVGDLEVRVESIEGVLLGLSGALAVLVRLTSLAPPPGGPDAVELMLGPEQSCFRAALPFAHKARRRYAAAALAYFEDHTQSIELAEEMGEVVIFLFGPPGVK